MKTPNLKEINDKIIQLANDWTNENEIVLNQKQWLTLCSKFLSFATFILGLDFKKEK